MRSNCLPILLALALVAAPTAMVTHAKAADEVVFTRTDGLSGAGRTLFTWLRRARWHGLDLEADPIIAAWIEGSGRAVALHPQGSLAPPGLLAEDPHGAQLAVEHALRQGLTRLVAELPPRPRTEAVLEDPKHQYYLSPDVLWRGVPAPVASDEAVALALDAARAGTLEAHLTSLAPKHTQYARLVAASERYQALCDNGGWPALAIPKSEKAAAAPDVARAFQDRLAVEGFYTGPPSGVWDEPTRAALTAFRDARQVRDRGLVDRPLYDALNVTCQQRLRTLALNARRWRVSAWHSEPTWVEVNLAAQELRFVRDHTLVRHERTVVGSDQWFFHKRLGRRLYMNASPILTDRISRVVINPIWAVPPRIGKNEIDPKVAADPTYLETHGFTVVTNATGGTQYIQRAGAGNALGQIKILFPNTESVYLHDTSKRAAFRAPVRALSHGCVRVQNALDLGVDLLATDAAASGVAFDEEQVRQQVFRGTRNYDLTTEIPVYFEYYTASVDELGVVRFHPDIYNYDADTFAADQVAAP